VTPDHHRRRPLRRPVRAARRKAGAGDRFRHGHRAGDPRAAASAACAWIRSDAYVLHSGAGSPALPCAPRRRCATRAHDRRPRRGRQFQVADEEGRCERRALRAHRRRRRGVGRRSQHQAVARERRSGRVPLAELATRFAQIHNNSNAQRE
jgi:hypothetical protein